MSECDEHPLAMADDGDDAEGDRLAADAVEDYLRQHPDFFADRAELLRQMLPPERWSGDTVVDLQRFMVESLRGEIAGLRDCANEVIETSRANLSIQTRTHAAVLALVASPDLPSLVRVVGDDLPILLDVDVATLRIERSAPTVRMVGGVGYLPTGAVDGMIGAGRDVALMRTMTDDGTVFGEGAGLVRSAALARIRCGDPEPTGMLAFGSRRESAFHPGQGTELLRFLAKIVEVCLIRLLAIPA